MDTLRHFGSPRGVRKVRVATAIRVPRGLRKCRGLIVCRGFPSGGRI